MGSGTGACFSGVNAPKNLQQLFFILPSKTSEAEHVPFPFKITRKRVFIGTKPQLERTPSGGRAPNPTSTVTCRATVHFPNVLQCLVSKDSTRDPNAALAFGKEEIKGIVIRLPVVPRNAHVRQFKTKLGAGVRVQPYFVGPQ